jgi:hypothetical protein
MGLTRDDHSVEIGDTTVAVRGHTGPVHATWELVVDGETVDSAKAAGDFTLRGRLPDGSSVEALVHQSLMGPTRVVVEHAGDEVATFSGFVA